MDAFEYFVVLSSIILGLGIAQILTGVADIFSNLKNVKTGWSHSILIFNVFLLHVQEWWYTFQYQNEVMTWTLPLVLFLLTYPIILYLLARMLFPTGTRSGETDLDAYFHDQWKWFYCLLLGVVIASFLQNVIISGYAIDTQISHYIFSLMLIGFVTLNVQSKLAHRIFIIAQAIVWIGYIVLDSYSLM